MPILAVWWIRSAEVATTLNPSETQAKLIEYQPAMVILLVDDDFLFRSAIKGILQKEGFQIIEAGDGIEGYNIIKEIGASIDLLLTDIRMPRMDGLSFAESVKELHPRMPILLMTGYARSLQNPMSYVVLRKPFLRQALIDAVRYSIVVPAIAPEKSLSDSHLLNELDCSLPFGTGLDPRLEDHKRKIEVFSAGCCCCEEIITEIRAAACPFCEITVLDIREASVAERAKQLGVRFVPAVAINGELVGNGSAGGPDLEMLRAAGLGMPLS